MTTSKIPKTTDFLSVIKSASKSKNVDELTNFQIRTHSDGRKYFFISGKLQGNKKVVQLFNSLTTDVDLNKLNDVEIEAIANKVAGKLLANENFKLADLIKS